MKGEDKRREQDKRRQCSYRQKVPLLEALSAMSSTNFVVISNFGKVWKIIAAKVTP
jgi:hypothetical protein